MNDQEESFDEKPTMSGGIQNKVFREMSFVNYMTTISSNEKGQILNMIQYGGLSILPLLLILKLMKFYIPVDDPLKSSSEILIEVVLQLVVIIVAFFFIHKLILYIPTYSTMEYEKVNLLTVLLPVFFLMFTLDTKISEKLNILLDRVLISTGIKKEGMDHEEEDTNENTTMPPNGNMMLPPPQPTSVPQQTISSDQINPPQTTQRGVMPNMSNMNPQGGATGSMMNSFEPAASNEFGAPF